MKCRSCGTELDEQSAFCSACGERVAGNPATAERGEADAGRRVAEFAEQADEEAGEYRARAGLRPRRAVDEPEEMLWEGSFSPRAMYGEWIAAGVATLVALVIAAFVGLSQVGWLIVAGVIVIVWAALLLRFAWLRYGVYYRLTNQRFVHQTGILWRSTDRVEVIDMDDIRYEQGPLERLFNVGTIHISSSDRTHPELLLRGIENVSEVAGVIDSARRRERVRRGLHIESV